MVSDKKLENIKCRKKVSLIYFALYIGIDYSHLIKIFCETTPFLVSIPNDMSNLKKIVTL